MDTDPRVADAVLASLAVTWDADGVVADPAGDRIFARWVDHCPDDPGWNDWRLVGVVRPGGGVDWVTPGDNPVYPRVEAALRAGEAAGRLGVGPWVTVWWCRSTLDGPPGDRVSDWAADA